MPTTVPRWQTAAIMKKSKKNRHTPGFRPISTKFGNVTHANPVNRIGSHNFEFKKYKMADGRHFKNRKIARNIYIYDTLLILMWQLTFLIKNLIFAF